MQDTYEVSGAVQSCVTARKHTCLHVSVQGARMPLGGEPGERKCKRAEDKNLLTVFRRSNILKHCNCRVVACSSITVKVDYVPIYTDIISVYRRNKGVNAYIYLSLIHI